MITSKRLLAQGITEECPLIEDGREQARPLDRIWQDDQGVPTSFSYDNQRFLIFDEPLLWFGRRSWWDLESSLIPGQRSPSGLERSIWRVHGRVATQSLLADLLTPVMGGQPWLIIAL